MFILPPPHTPFPANPLHRKFISLSASTASTSPISSPTNDFSPLIDHLSFTSDLDSDRAALLSFRSAVSFASLISKWNPSASPCSFTSVLCEHDRITALRLPKSRLFGTIPSRMLGNLIALRILNLRFNSFTLPDDMGNLVELRSLFLQHNSIGAEIPSSISKLINLIRLNLADNKITGEILVDLKNLRRLVTLYWENNALTGQVPDLSLPNLVLFNVSYNSINGSTPKFLEKQPLNAFLGINGFCGGPFQSCKDAPSPATKGPKAVPYGEEGSKKHKLSGGAIAGIVIGCVVGFLILLLLLFLSCRRRKEPNGVRYSTIIPIWGKVGDRAAMLFQNFRNYSIGIDPVLYRAMIVVYLKVDLVGHSERFILESKNTNIVSKDSLIMVLAKAGSLEEAIWVFIHAVEAEEVNDMSIFSIIMEELSEYDTTITYPYRSPSLLSPPSSPNSSTIVFSVLDPASCNYDSNFSFNVFHIKLYDHNHQILCSLSDSYNKFVVGIPDVSVFFIANLKTTHSWFSTNITLIFPETKIIPIDNETLFDNINPFVFIIPTIGITATARSTLHSSSFVIGLILVHFISDKLSFTPNESALIFLSTITFSALISQSTDNLLYAISYHLRNPNLNIPASSHIDLLLTFKNIALDNTYSIFSYGMYGLFFTWKASPTLRTRSISRGR